MLTIFLIAISLSFDSFAASVGLAIANKKRVLTTALLISLIFSLFQGLMPFFGYMLGLWLKSIISLIDHWAALLLLCGIGIKFIIESKKTERRSIQKFDWKVVPLLGIATSIDAFVVGITFAFMKIDLWIALIFIFAITFLLSFAGYWLGGYLGRLWGRRAGLIGGIILIAIGLKILVSHLFF